MKSRGDLFLENNIQYKIEGCTMSNLFRIVTLISCIIFTGCRKAKEGAIFPYLVIDKESNLLAFVSGTDFNSLRDNYTGCKKSVNILDLTSRKCYSLHLDKVGHPLLWTWRFDPEKTELYLPVFDYKELFSVTLARLEFSRNKGIKLQKYVRQKFYFGPMLFSWGPDGKRLIVSSFPPACYFYISFDGGLSFEEIQTKESGIGPICIWLDNKRFFVYSRKAVYEMEIMEEELNIRKFFETAQNTEVMNLCGLFNNQIVYVTKINDNNNILYNIRRGKDVFYQSEHRIERAFSDGNNLALMQIIGSEKDQKVNSRELLVFDQNGMQIQRRAFDKDVVLCGIVYKDDAIYLLRDNKTILKYNYSKREPSNVETIYSIEK